MLLPLSSSSFPQESIQEGDQFQRTKAGTIVPTFCQQNLMDLSIFQVPNLIYKAHFIVRAYDLCPYSVLLGAPFFCRSSHMAEGHDGWATDPQTWHIISCSSSSFRHHYSIFQTTWIVVIKYLSHRNNFIRCQVLLMLKHLISIEASYCYNYGQYVLRATEKLVRIISSIW